jgi:hypothetical protein
MKTNQADVDAEVDGIFTKLDETAAELVAGRITEDFAQERVADLCTNNNGGPGVVRLFDAHYEKKLAELRSTS